MILGRPAKVRVVIKKEKPLNQRGAFALPDG
jgi:hypothetical protein